MARRSQLLKKYPTIAVGGVNGRIARLKGFKHLITFEPYVTCPEIWNIKVIDQYDSFITFNRKFCENRGILSKSYVMSGCFAGTIDFNSALTSIPYDEKIKGICILGKRGHDLRVADGNIYYLREEFLNNLLVEPYLVKHLYAHNPWGDSYYQGRCEPYDPWVLAPLKKVSEYLFCFCPENAYHPLWSWGYLSERLLRCFKAKTVAIYIGCYNIDELVPKDLYIDFRDFKEDYGRLSEYLINFPKEKYLDMTERAYKWSKTCKIGLIKDFENLLKAVVEKENR